MKKLIAVIILLILFCGCAEEKITMPTATIEQENAETPLAAASFFSSSAAPSEITPSPSSTSLITPPPSPKGTIGVYYAGSGEKARRLVTIDAGHQQKGIKETEPNGPGSSAQKAKLSSGTAGKVTRVPEYQLNLTVSLALREELLNRGYSVYMIRITNDAPVSNKERAEMANAVGADIFLRIHANGSEDPSVRGAMMVCQSSANPSTQQYEFSSRLSEMILQGYCQETQIPQKKGSAIWETDTMTGINWCKVPSSTLEMGYMSNSEDDLAMAEDGFALAAARGIADGVDAYFSN